MSGQQSVLSKALDDLKADPRCQARECMDEQALEEYADAYRSGEPLPPLDCFEVEGELVIDEILSAADSSNDLTEVLSYCDQFAIIDKVAGKTVNRPELQAIRYAELRLMRRVGQMLPQMFPHGGDRSLSKGQRAARSHDANLKRSDAIQKDRADRCIRLTRIEPFEEWCAEMRAHDHLLTPEAAQ